jgi:hypothetical protein
MPRFYFHLRTADDCISDERELILRGRNVSAREMIAVAIKAGDEHVPTAFVIADEAGRAVESISFQAMLPKVMTLVRAVPHWLRRSLGSGLLTVLPFLIRMYLPLRRVHPLEHVNRRIFDTCKNARNSMKLLKKNHHCASIQPFSPEAFRRAAQTEGAWPCSVG